MPIDTCHPEAKRKLNSWDMLKAVLAGEEAVKAKGTLFLPKPNPSDTSLENSDRYSAYIQRAVFYPVTGRTLDGMLGYVFANTPKVELHELLASLATNVDGAGTGLVAQSKHLLSLLLGYGRAGLLVDYPAVTEATTMQDLRDGNISPTIVIYRAEDIINWSTQRIGAKVFLDRLVLREAYYTEDSADSYTLKEAYRYREYKRTDEGVSVAVYIKVSDNYAINSNVTPLDKEGQPLKEIPFVFVGAENNDPSVDVPPLEALARLNLAHYRNSADWEEACYITGQPTVALFGLTKDWVDEVLKGKITFGSRAAIMLPVNGGAEILQAQPNPLPKQAMDQKEKQMVAIGARLIQEATVQRTATEITVDRSSEVSVLVAATTNVWNAYKAALGICAKFVGAGDSHVIFTITEPLAPEVLDQDRANALVLLWNAGLLSFTETRKALQKTGLADTLEDEVLLADAEKRREANILLKQTQALPH